MSDYCNMLDLMGEMGMGASYCVTCENLKRASVMRSGAGYYVGTSTPGGFPQCRISRYVVSEYEAEKMLEFIKVKFGEGHECN